MLMDLSGSYSFLWSINGHLFRIAVEAFKKTDEEYLNEEKAQQKDAGSTASTVVLLGDRVLVANVGDSRVVASRAGSGNDLLC